jgi:hypothetical protein
MKREKAQEEKGGKEGWRGSEWKQKTRKCINRKRAGGEEEST